MLKAASVCGEGTLSCGKVGRNYQLRGDVKAAMKCEVADLKTVAREICHCTLCPLAKNRINAVPGEGPDRARLLLVGEAPGREEDLCGRPFVGRAGRVLDQALQGAGVARRQVFLTNLVKCRPPHNRRPTKMEVETCVSAHLRRQIELVHPRVIGLLGRTAVKALLGKEGLARLRGRLIEKERRYVVTYHPAAAGRSRAWYRAFRADMKTLKKLIGAR